MWTFVLTLRIYPKSQVEISRFPLSLSLLFGDFNILANFVVSNLCSPVNCKQNNHF